MTEFIPPFPKRHEKNIGAFEILKYGYRDLLSIWTEKSFRSQFMKAKVLNHFVFIANCPEIVRYVFITQHTNYEKKSFVMRKALAPLLGDGLFISDGDIWQKHRSMEAPLFSTDYVAQYSDTMIKVIAEYVRQWHELKEGETLDVLPEMGKLTAEIICQTLFGNRLDKQQATQVVSNFARYQACLDLRFPDWLPTPARSRTRQAAKNIHDVVDNVIAQGAKNTNQDTLLAYLLQLRDDEHPERGLTSKQIRNELIVLFMAGHETTANTLAWAWYLISQSPEVEKRLHAEVDEVLGNRCATFADFSKLTYTLAIIEETLRLYPPVPFLSREAMADDVIRGRHIPAGSTMLVVPWLLHRHKLYWDKPDHFIPERFLPDALVKRTKFTYLPFSIGPRVCLAKFFGQVESTLCLAILARHFRLVLPLGTEVRHECRLTLRPENNLPMQLIKR